MNQAADKGGAMDLAGVRAALPHRDPMLLVDRVESLVADHSIVAVKAVTFNEQFFQGHFPGRPIMPGVLIVEALARAAYHLGNRHVAVQVGEGWLRLAADHVLEHMLHGLGARTRLIEAPFEPEAGAYASGHSHQGGHGHSHGEGRGARIHEYGGHGHSHE